jgi:syntaxin-binding protein 5
MHLPFQSNWLFIGTEKGNTYLLNIYNNFSQSGYDIKWNNVIQLSQKTKPGRVVHLSDHPLDPSKVLIGFDSGLIVLWNLKIKRAEFHYYGTSEAMSSIGWFYDAKQFMSAHNNGSLIVWSTKGETKPTNILHPHMNETDLVPRYNMIKKVCWESTTNSKSSTNDSLIIFSDGLPSSDCVMRDAITIIKNNKLKTIIEMKEKIIDFLVIPASPWTTENPTDPVAIIALLENNLVVVDLRTEGYPQFQHHHPTGLHESPLTATFYLTEPSRVFFRGLLASRDKYLQDQWALQQNQLNQQRQNAAGGAANATGSGGGGGVTTSKQVFSPLSYPINGGLKCTKANVFGYPELIVTGHEDGTVKFWDSTGLGLTLLHKLKTQKLFDKRKFEANSSQIEVDEPFKITALTHSRNYLAVAALGGHVTLYKFYNKCSTEVGLADIPVILFYSFFPS